MLTYRIHLSRVFLSMRDVAAAALSRTEPHYSYHGSRMYNSVLQMYGVLKPVNTDNADRALQTQHTNLTRILQPTLCFTASLFPRTLDAREASRGFVHVSACSTGAQTTDRSRGRDVRWLNT
jgi:hypothetical protein